jgi:hypothetical protein
MSRGLPVGWGLAYSVLGALLLIFFFPVFDEIYEVTGLDFLSFYFEL